MKRSFRTKIGIAAVQQSKFWQGEKFNKPKSSSDFFLIAGYHSKRNKALQQANSFLLCQIAQLVITQFSEVSETVLSNKCFQYALYWNFTISSKLRSKLKTVEEEVVEERAVSSWGGRKRQHFRSVVFFSKLFYLNAFIFGLEF